MILGLPRRGGGGGGGIEPESDKHCDVSGNLMYVLCLEQDCDVDENPT